MIPIVYLSYVASQLYCNPDVHMAAYICQDISKLLGNNNQKIILHVNVERQQVTDRASLRF